MPVWQSLKPLPNTFGNGIPSKLNQDYLIAPINQNGVIMKYNMQHNVWSQMMKFNIFQFRYPIVSSIDIENKMMWIIQPCCKKLHLATIDLISEECKELDTINKISILGDIDGISVNTVSSKLHILFMDNAEVDPMFRHIIYDMETNSYSEIDCSNVKPWNTYLGSVYLKSNK